MIVCYDKEVFIRPFDDFRDKFRPAEEMCIRDRSVVSASDFIKVIDAYEEENSTDVLLGSIDCFTEDTYEMFNKKGYNGKERIDYLVGKYGAIVAPSFVAMKNALELSLIHISIYI